MQDTQQHRLPRIQSLSKVQRIHTATNPDRKNSEESTLTHKIGIKNLEITNNARQNSQRKTLKSANSSKAVKYEASSAIYARKIQGMHQQSQLIDQEIEKITQEINEFRAKKHTEDGFPLGQSKASKSTLSRRSELEGTSKGETKIIENKLQALRKRIDKENELNKQIEKDIDVVRKQITTTKKLNSQLFESLNKINENHSNSLNLSAKLQESISQANDLLQKRKIQNIHNKAQLMKSYETILRKIDTELEEDKAKKSNKFDKTTKKSEQSRVQQKIGDFYLTNLGHHKDKPIFIEAPKGESPPKSKKLQQQITSLKEKLVSYDKQFAELKQKTNSNNIEEITRKVAEEYQKNYDQYTFINEIYANLEEKRQKNRELLDKKIQIMKDIEDKCVSRVQSESFALKKKLTDISHKKSQKQKQKSEVFSKFKEIKAFCIDFLTKIPIKQLAQKYNSWSSQDFEEQINEQNLSDFLEYILHFKQQVCPPTEIKLTTKTQGHTDSSHGSCDSNESDALVSGRKDHLQGNKQRLHTREEFLKQVTLTKENEPKPKKILKK